MNRSTSDDTRASHGIDPAIRRFVQDINAAYARYPGLDTLPLSRRRQIAEEVRAPWVAGGPQMACSIDTAIPTRLGPMKARVHNPSSTPAKGALIYLHGGGWTLFSINTHDRLMREYAARADMLVVGLDYALSPEVPFPGALHQVIEAVRWIRSHGKQLDLDPSRLALGGDSAGGNLTLAACLTLRDAGEPHAVRAMVLNYAVVERTLSPEAHRYDGEEYMLGGDEMAAFWTNYAGPDDGSRNPLLYPLHAQLTGLPPAFLAIPEYDILTEQNLLLAKKLQAAGVPTQTVVYRGATHSFLEAVSIASLSERAFEDTAGWLRVTLAGAG